jgi:hypothetical protein
VVCLQWKLHGFVGKMSQSSGQHWAPCMLSMCVFFSMVVSWEPHTHNTMGLLYFFFTCLKNVVSRKKSNYVHDSHCIAICQQADQNLFRYCRLREISFDLFDTLFIPLWWHLACFDQLYSSFCTSFTFLLMAIDQIYRPGTNSEDS